MTQCKDIPDEPILHHVYVRNLAGRWALCDGVSGEAFPPETPDNLYWAKMRSLGRRGLLFGCFCGCRGDYVVSEKGCELLGLPWHGIHEGLVYR